MNNYNRNNRSGGGRFGGGGNFRRRDSGRRQMHEAVCDKCGRNCEVPFRPSGEKPIYCSNCFEGKDGGLKRSERSDFGKRDNTSKQLLEQVSSLNEKLDRIIAVIESKVEDKSDLVKTEFKKTVEKAVPKEKVTKKRNLSKKEA